MIYRAKWIEDHLGITRRALRMYEDSGLMPKNENNQYREYDEHGLERIWAIKVLQGIGYTLKEIKSLLETADEEWITHSLPKKIAELERDVEKSQRHLGYAKMILVTGRIPALPNELGTVKHDVFQEMAESDWNINMDPVGEAIYQLTNTSPEEWGESEAIHVAKMFDELGSDGVEMMLVIGPLTKAIIARRDLVPSSDKIQLLVELIYEQFVQQHEDMTPQQFSRCFSSSLMEGSIGHANQQQYGIEGCSFVANAVAVFGGYKNYEDIF